MAESDSENLHLLHERVVKCEAEVNALIEEVEAALSEADRLWVEIGKDQIGRGFMAVARTLQRMKGQEGV